MSDYICQKNIKKPEPTVDDVKKPTWNRPTVASTVSEKPDSLLITSMAATAITVFFGIRTLGIAQQSAFTHINVFGITNAIADSLRE